MPACTYCGRDVAWEPSAVQVAESESQPVMQLPQVAGDLLALWFGAGLLYYLWITLGPPHLRHGQQGVTYQKRR